MRAISTCLALIALYAFHAEAFAPVRGLRRGRIVDLQMNNVRKSPNRRDRMITNALESVEFSRKPQQPAIALMDDPLIPMVSAIVNAADQRKASSISAFRVASISEITTFMIVVEGNSRPQNQAIALAVEDAVLLDFTTQASKQGDSGSGWILLDYGIKMFISAF
jgi:ribosomal silencing factor RsfS